MFMNNSFMRKKYSSMLLVALVSVLTVGIAYAALSSTLTVTMNKVTQNALSFGPTISSCSKTNDVGTSATGRTCGAISATSGSTAVTVADTTLSKPEDACVYKCTIQNPTGYIPAKINSIVPTAPTSTTCGTITNASSSASAAMVCGNITYGIYATASVSGTTITTTNFTTGQTLAANSTKDFYLVVRYSGTELNSSAVTQSAGKFTFTFGQN